jgi:hypothetical protein
MRFLLALAVAFLAGIIVLAVVFRSESARSYLRFIRNLGFAYVALIAVLAAIRVWQQGGLW